MDARCKISKRLVTNGYMQWFAKLKETAFLSSPPPLPQPLQEKTSILWRQFRDEETRSQGNVSKTGFGSLSDGHHMYTLHLPQYYIVYRNKRKERKESKAK